MNTKNFIEKFGRFTSITAPAGYGKSMFMKYMFVNEKYIQTSNKTNLIPILINSRMFNRSEGTIEKMLHDKVFVHMQISLIEFLNDLKQGGFLLLFDGLDEIKNSEVNAFFIQLNNLTIKYSNNYFITSSRPSELMECIFKFKVINLNGFKTKQAINLISKLPNYDNESKKAFCYLLNNSSYKKYSKLIENPLLLTLMFLIYVGNKKITTKSYQFYEKAFAVLYEEHEKLKGHEPRVFKTNLKKSYFSLLLSEFCFHTAHLEPIEFTEIDVLKTLKKTSFSALSSDDFIDDLRNNLNLITYENEKYHFIHNLFHDYFCAKYLSDIDDNDFKNLDIWFESLGNKKNFCSSIKGKEIMSFLLEINKEKTFKVLINPYLNKLTLGQAKNSFFNFLSNSFQLNHYGNNIVIEPKTHFMKIILVLNNLNVYTDLNSLPIDCKMVTIDNYKSFNNIINDNTNETIKKFLEDENSCLLKVYKSLFKHKDK